MTPCPRCGGPQILLLTSWACKAECDRAKPMEVQRSETSLTTMAFVRMVDTYYAPVTGLRTEDILVQMLTSRQAGRYLSLGDYWAEEIGMGEYKITITDKALAEVWAPRDPRVYFRIRPAAAVGILDTIYFLERVAT